ncbi:hypothetical protein [Methyloglobulus sp.]|uniref:hypothetical protein n=1 Tax=Methyloglobulus sp. TaxID=2518622 RepID=UPI0032B7DAE1
MKYSKFLLLALCLSTVTVQAETIDVGGSQGVAGAAGTVAKACVKAVFIKRNSGTLVTGLTTAKVKPFSVIETSFSLTGIQTTKNFSVTYSLAVPVTVPATPPYVYDFCITPTGVGNVWKKPPNIGHFYTIDGVILGTVAADNGVVSATFH